MMGVSGKHSGTRSGFEPSFQPNLILNVHVCISAEEALVEGVTERRDDRKVAEPQNKI